MSIQQEKFKAIADKIREKTGATELIKPNDFTEKINEVYDAGKQAEYDRFWDDFQNKGGATGCAYLFYGTGAWNMNLYKPKYNWYATYTAAAMFQGATWLTDTIVNLNFTDATMTNIGQLFQGCTNLVNARTIILPKFGVGMGYSFYNCQKLQEVRFRPKVTKSSLITMPFNEAFVKDEYASVNDYYLGEGIYDAYSEYFTPDLFGGGSMYRVTSLVFENGERIENVYRYDDGLRLRLPDWFIPEDETQEVSFYLENPNTECIYGNISFAESSVLSRDSITSIFKALSSDVADKKLTLKKTAVNAAFNMDVDADESTWNYEYTTLVYARSNWTIAYA